MHADDRRREPAYAARRLPDRPVALPPLAPVVSTAPVATLAMDVAEDGGIGPATSSSSTRTTSASTSSLHDAVQRIRFEHPEVRAVVLTSAQAAIFCSGANIFMLGLSTHAWKVNFCKFTNETRNGLEDSSRALRASSSSPRSTATCAGGGYELALACDEIVLVDDRSSAVSLPEVPLLGVLPGTGGLTRLTDKRHVRHDLADIFCTTTEGVRGQRAQGLAAGRRAREARAVSTTAVQRARARAGRGRATARRTRSGVALPPLARTRRRRGLSLRARRRRDRPRAPRSRRSRCARPPRRRRRDIAGIDAAGAAWWPLAMARELDDAILTLRTNELDVGTWLLPHRRRRRGACSPPTRTLAAHRDHWFVRETIGHAAPHARAPRRVVAHAVRADRAGLVLRRHAARAGARRRPQLHGRAAGRRRRARRAIVVSDANFGAYPMVNGQSRLAQRFYGEAAPLAPIRAARRAARSARPRRWRSASSPPRPTTSTGPTRSASRSRSARACRPTR